MSNQYLFYISENYSFEILRPLQKLIFEKGDTCAWFVEGKSVNLNYFKPSENRLKNIKEVIAYNACAVFVPGNVVPCFIPGFKVQVFHGLEWKKKGHFQIRGFFDLYTTHGKITTSRFKELATQYGYFQVKETGWSKLDPLFQTKALPLKTELPVVLFAPTFSPSLTCAVECLDEIKRIIKRKNHYWIVKFHPKMNKEWVEAYQKIKQTNYQIVETDSCLPLLQRADVLFSDTSSIIAEFLLLGKPAVTYKNIQPGKYLINTKSVSNIEAAINLALNASQELKDQIKLENIKLHPYTDGKSSDRILKAVNQLLENPVTLEKKKPANWFRNLKLRFKLNYWAS